MTKNTYDYYVDDFGNLKKKKNLKNWSDYGPWQSWKHRYNWIKCDDDFEAFDRLCWRDDVFADSPHGQTLHEASRFMIGEIRKIKDSKQGMLAAIVVLHAEGLEAYPQQTQIYRQIRKIVKYGAYRSPRFGEGEWSKKLPENDLYPKRMALKDQRAREQIDDRVHGSAGEVPFSRFFSGSAKFKIVSRSYDVNRPPKPPKL